MKDLDVIIILNSGVIEQRFAETVLQKRNNAKDRLLWFMPTNRNKNEFDYIVRTDKKSFMLNYNGESIPNLFPYFTINPSGYSFYLDNPSIRLSDDPKPDNAVLLVDNYKCSGNTMDHTRNSLLCLGYSDKNIYSYAKRKMSVTQEICEITNPEGKIISEEEFFKSILN